MIDLEIVILSEASQREGEISHDIRHIQNLIRNYTGELVYKTETDF